MISVSLHIDFCALADVGIARYRPATKTSSWLKNDVSG
jgi:hypothetical protein